MPAHPPHDYPHSHPRRAHAGHGHRRGDRGGMLGRLARAVKPHAHEPGCGADTVLETSAQGIRALWVSLAALGVTAGLQAAVAVISGSVALLGDTLHNLADALTAVPLGIAFLLGRRAPNRRYTYGYGRAEDLAGVLIVAVIAASAALTAYAAADRLLHPHPVSELPAVALAALIGFAGNEWVARYRVRVGRRIGSAALVADGLHARTDGFVSLAVLLGAGGVALGWPAADPIVGLVITAAILVVLYGAARQVYRRIMDAVDPELVDRVEATLRATPGVLDVGELRVRWVGHQLRAECTIVVDSAATLIEAHDVAVRAQHELLHALPRLTAAMVHADPFPRAGSDHHAVLAHHRRPQ